MKFKALVTLEQGVQGTARFIIPRMRVSPAGAWGVPASFLFPASRVRGTMKAAAAGGGEGIPEELPYTLGLLHAATALRLAPALRSGRLSFIVCKRLPRLIKLSRLWAGKKLSIYGNAVFIPMVKGR
jgi:hypothetical protein